MASEPEPQEPTSTVLHPYPPSLNSCSVVSTMNYGEVNNCLSGVSFSISAYKSLEILAIRIGLYYSQQSDLTQYQYHVLWREPEQSTFECAQAQIVKDEVQSEIRCLTLSLPQPISLQVGNEKQICIVGHNVGYASCYAANDNPITLFKGADLQIIQGKSVESKDIDAKTVSFATYYRKFLGDVFYRVAQTPFAKLFNSSSKSKPYPHLNDLTVVW